MAHMKCAACWPRTCIALARTTRSATRPYEAGTCQQGRACSFSRHSSNGPHSTCPDIYPAHRLCALPRHAWPLGTPQVVVHSRGRYRLALCVARQPRPCSCTHANAAVLPHVALARFLWQLQLLQQLPPPCVVPEAASASASDSASDSDSVCVRGRSTHGSSRRCRGLLTTSRNVYLRPQQPESPFSPSDVSQHECTHSLPGVTLPLPSST